MPPSRTHDPAVGTDRHRDPVGLLQDLIRFDTTNPPGDERACIEWIDDLLAAYGVDADTYAADPERPALLARLPGGSAAPLLVYGHVDVVPAAGEWTHPPFEAVHADGCIWGRGALDMKGGVAMFLAAFLDLAASEATPAGDVLLCLVPDEEVGGDAGMAHLVDTHPELFGDVEYAIGEFGGFPYDIAGERFYPIQVAEKQVCRLALTVRGAGGHGALPHRGTAMARLGRILTRLDGTRLPVHVDPVAAEMARTMAGSLSPPTSWVLKALTYPRLTDSVLDRLGPTGERLEALTHNTVNPTIVSGGNKENVVPETVSLTLDARLLPGQRPPDVIREIEEVIGDLADHVTIDVTRFDPGPDAADMGLFPLLGDALRSADGDATPVPFLLPASTDARHLDDVGVQSYGFTPMNLPPAFAFMDLIHAPDERIPADCVEWGTERVAAVLRRYDGVPDR